jgi:hypothetical protein
MADQVLTDADIAQHEANASITSPTTSPTSSAPVTASAPAVLSDADVAKHDQGLGGYQNLIDLGKGVMSGAASTVFHGGDLIRRALGMKRVINDPQVQSEITPPDSTAGKIGHGLEQGAEFFAPIPGEGKIKALSAGKGLVTRMLTHGAVDAAHNGIIAGAQSGGDPTTTGVAAGIGGVVGATIPAVGDVYNAAAKLTQDVNPVRKGVTDAATQAGMEVDPATRTGSPMLRQLKKSLSTGPKAGAAEDLANRQNNQFEQWGKNLQSRVSPGAPLEPDQAGQGAYNALDKAQQSFSSEADQQFGGIRAQAKMMPAQKLPVKRWEMQPTGQVDQLGNAIMAPKQVQVDKYFHIPVDRSNLQTALRPLLNSYGTLSIAEQQASPALPIIKEIVNGDSVVEATQALNDLSAMYGKFKLERGQIGRDVNQFFGSKGMQAYRQTVDSALSSANPGLLDAANAGRAATGKKWGTIRLMNQIGGRVDPATPYSPSSLEPVKVFQNLTRNGDTAVTALRQFQHQAPQQIPVIASTTLQGLLDTSSAHGADGAFSHAQAALNQWNRLGPQTKSILYGPQMVQDLDNFFRMGKYLAENPNPSNTGMHIWLAARMMTLFSGHLGMAAKDTALELALGKYLFSTRGPVPYFTSTGAVNPLSAGAAGIFRNATGIDPATLANQNSNQTSDQNNSQK